VPVEDRLRDKWGFLVRVRSLFVEIACVTCRGFLVDMVLHAFGLPLLCVLWFACGWRGCWSRFSEARASSFDAVLHAFAIAAPVGTAWALTVAGGCFWVRPLFGVRVEIACVNVPGLPGLTRCFMPLAFITVQRMQ